MRQHSEEQFKKVCDTFEELIDALKNKDYEIEKTLEFKSKVFENYDSHAADRAIDSILPLLDEEKVTKPNETT